MLKGECPECHAFRERYFFCLTAPCCAPNNKYRMIYLNMGHGDGCFSDAAQKLLFTNAFRWVVSKSPKANPFEK